MRVAPSKFWQSLWIYYTFIVFVFLSATPPLFSSQQTHFEQETFSSQSANDSSEQQIPFGLTLESKQCQSIHDAFDNQIAMWITDGRVYASTKEVGANWQPLPELLSSPNETVTDFQLGVDSIGNVFAIWQTKPTQWLQVAIKTPEGSWQVETVAELQEEESEIAQVAAGPMGCAIAAWKIQNQGSAALQLTEISLPLVSIDSDFDSSFDEKTSRNTQFISLSSHQEVASGQPSLHAFENSNRISTRCSSENSESEACPELPARLPFPPTHLRGCQVANQFATQTDRINIITWKAAKKGPQPVAYYIYRDDALKHLVAMIPADKELKFKDHNRKKGCRYSYFIVAVDACGIQSPPTGIIFKGSKTHLIKSRLPVAIAIAPLNPTLTIGSTIQFIATVTLSNGKERNLTDVTWCSSNPSVATIDSQGVATGLSVGTTTIRAVLCGVSAATTLTVVCPSITITTAALPTASLNVPYAQTIQTTGGIPPLNFAIVSGNLPAGLMLDSNTGLIAGIPTTTGTFNFTVRATSSCGSFDDKLLSITISCPPITITTTALPNGQMNAPYSQTLQTTGGIAPLNFAIVSGNLPAGLTLDSNTGLISGTPTTIGTFNFTIRSTSSCSSFNDKLLSITIPCPPITITTTTLPNGQVIVPYSQTLQTTGGVAPLTFAIVSGNLPAGLILDNTTGLIAGIPTTTGTFNFTVRATSSCGSFDDKLLSLTFCPSFTVTTNPSSLPTGTYGIPYNASLVVTGGTPPFTATIIDGILPPGLTFNPMTLAISGTPTAPGNFGFEIRITDACGATITRTFVISIACVTFSPSVLPNATVLTPYSALIEVITGATVLDITIEQPPSSNFDFDVNLDTGTIIITGNPLTAGPITFIVTVVTSDCGTVIQNFPITILCPPITITTATLPNGQMNAPYSQTLQTTGGIPPLTFTIVNGNLPTGLTLDNSTGLISGTPTTAGTFNFTVRATSSCGSFNDMILSINLTCPSFTVTTNPSPLPIGVLNLPYEEASITVTGGTPPFNASLIGSLPPGLNFDPTTLIISGNPTMAGDFDFSIQITDACGATTTQAFEITIACAIFEPSSFPIAHPGIAYQAVIEVITGAIVTSIDALLNSPSLGLSAIVNGNTVTISGTPTSLGSVFLQIRVETESCTINENFSIRIEG